MLRKPKKAGQSGDDSILPLINVVFLLLVFFMVAGRLTASDPFTVEPVTAANGGVEPAGPPLLHVGADGALALSGVEMDEARLMAALSSAPPEGLRIKADAGAEAVALVRLLGRLRAAGVGEIHLLTARPAGAG